MKKEIITTDIRKQGEVDVGFALDTLVGNVLGMVVWHEEGEQDGHPVSSAVGDSDGTQLRALRRRHHAGSTVRLRAGSAGWLGRLAYRRRAGRQPSRHCCRRLGRRAVGTLRSRHHAASTGRQRAWSRRRCCAGRTRR